MGTSPASSAPDRGHLTGLVDNVDDARRQLESGRASGAHPVVQQQLRRALLTALEDYTGALEKIGQPVPYGMRLEIQLFRSLGRLP